MAPAQQRAIVVKGGSEDPAAAANLETKPVPEPQQGEVLVQLRLRPCNPADVFTLQGVYPGADTLSITRVIWHNRSPHADNCIQLAALLLY